MRYRILQVLVYRRNRRPRSEVWTYLANQTCSIGKSTAGCTEQSSRNGIWRGSRFVVRYVREQCVIENTIAGAQNCLVFSENTAPESWSVGEAHTRTKVVSVFPNADGRGKGIRWFPLNVNRREGEDIRGIIVELVTQAEIDGEVWFGVNGVLEVEALLEDLRPNHWISERQVGSIGQACEVIDEIGEATESLAATEGQRASRIKRNRIAHDNACNVAANLKGLYTLYQRVGVLELIGRVSSSLRKARIDSEQREVCSGDAVNCREVKEWIV